MSEVYYNELNQHSADWLKNLMMRGQISHGKIDTRSIVDVKTEDIQKFTRCHFFAGIGCWDLVLNQVGCPTDLSVWTGSCPCQPFSVAGKQKGFDDERHLWPIWFNLIRECRPSIIFGEQSSSKAGLQWLDLVSSDLEKEDYSIGAADLCAAGVGAPHLRQRLYFVAYSNSSRFNRESILLCRRESQPKGSEVTRGGEVSIALGDPDLSRLEGRKTTTCGGKGAVRAPSLESFWSNAEWLPGSDGKFRPAEPGTFPLVDGDSFKLGSGCPQEGKSRKHMIEGYGNAIVPPVALKFVESFFDFLCDSQ